MDRQAPEAAISLFGESNRNEIMEKVIEMYNPFSPIFILPYQEFGIGRLTFCGNVFVVVTTSRGSEAGGGGE